MKKSVVVLAAAAAIVGAAQLEAQVVPSSPFSVEVRGGLALPQGDFGEDLETGYTLGANVQFAVNPLLSLYAGYAYNSYSIDGVDDLDVNDRGFNGGVQLNIPAATLPVQPFVRGGLVYNELEFAVEGASVNFDSQLGFEVGGGVAIPLGPRISFTPAVSYSRWSVDEEELDGSDLDELDVTSVKVDVGLKIRI